MLAIGSAASARCFTMPTQLTMASGRAQSMARAIASGSRTSTPSTVRLSSKRPPGYRRAESWSVAHASKRLRQAIHTRWPSMPPPPTISTRTSDARFSRPLHVFGQSLLEADTGLVAECRARRADVGEAVPHVPFPRVGVDDTRLGLAGAGNELRQPVDRDA